jgi:hypothetical protein
MLDPEGYDADGDDQTDWCRTWRLEFRRTDRGNRKNMAEVDMRLLRIGIFIETLVANGMKAEAAKAKAREEFGISLAQANKALTAARKVLAFEAPDFLDHLAEFSDATPQPAPKGKS